MPDWTILDPTFADCFAALDSGFQQVYSSRRETDEAMAAHEADAIPKAAQIARGG